MLTPDGLRPARVTIEDGRIAALSYRLEGLPAPDLDVGDDVVMPGVIDTHVHVNEPGRTSWEGFETASRAAAAGGVTTLVDMPLNSTPATTTPAALEAKVRSARNRCHVDYGFWGGAVAGNDDQLETLAEAGVLGFKCFLIDSGVDDFEALDLAGLRTAMKRLATLRTRGGPGMLLAHAEWPATVDGARPHADADPARYATWLGSRPPEAECDAIQQLIDCMRETSCPVHVVHLATGSALPMLDAARRDKLPISVETCPHYLTFAAEDIPDGDPRFKCAPPIRRAAEREALWRGLQTGSIDAIVSDHSPAPPALRRLDDGNLLTAWGGIASVQLTLPAVWTEAEPRGIDIATVSRWLSAAPATLAGLVGRKGHLAVGYDADMVIWRPESSFVVEGHALEHRHAPTPYEERTLRGVVTRTVVRGHTVFHHAGPEAHRFLDTPHGEWLRPR